ncbi:unnamed protein product [Ambrosiozyma monospora]|uniref:Unnamed protein product n=1 Tax=Ambrosiozyma monospora TaxID=43982 RepID=A0ACB5SSN0_AMBMO|nr:unnamed protein product [Ambrosiozyma monospora]
MVRVISVYVPTTVKEKKLFLEQLTLELDMIDGDFNCVEEDNERDAVAKRGVGEEGVRPVSQQTGAASSRGEADESDHRIYITPKLHQFRLNFKHLSKFNFSTHHQIQLSIWISSVDAGKPLYKIRTNITNNSNNVDFVTGFQILDLKDINLKLDDFCLKVIQRAKTLSHYLNVFKDGSSSTTSNESFGKATANPPTALLNVNEALKQQLPSNPDSSPGKDGISYRFIDRAFSSFGPLLVEGFIQGRSFHHNIQQLQQLVDKMNQDPLDFRESFILQLDFQKAFDRVSHQFLQQQLEQIYMPPNIINAIYHVDCLATTGTSLRQQLPRLNLLYLTRS